MFLWMWYVCNYQGYTVGCHKDTVVMCNDVLDDLLHIRFDIRTESAFSKPILYYLNLVIIYIFCKCMAWNLLPSYLIMLYRFWSLINKYCINFLTKIMIALNFMTVLIILRKKTNLERTLQLCLAFWLNLQVFKLLLSSLISDKS